MTDCRGYGIALVVFACACGGTDDSRTGGEDAGCGANRCAEAGTPEAKAPARDAASGTPMPDGRAGATCGNATVEDGEECDDGNRQSGDGCQDDCMLPVCGDGVVDEGESCDDGNQTGADGCEADCTWSACSADEDCDDNAFCNGEERCVEGMCAAGEPPELDDGVTCTIDTCDDDLDTAVHTPDNSACAHLDGDPRCATDGELSGNQVRSRGVCDAELDCQETVELVDDCSSAVPDPHPHCSGSAGTNDLTYHDSAQATCADAADAGPTCTYTETTTSCVAPEPSCSNAELTTYSPTCSAAEGCGVNPSTSACTAATARCVTIDGAPTRRSFRPACNGAGTACRVNGARTDTPCPTSPPSCTDAMLTTYTPTCTGKGVCGESSTTSPCPDPANTCTVPPSGGSPILTTYEPTCNGAGTACAAPIETQTTCVAGPSTCEGSDGLIYVQRPVQCNAAAGTCTTTVTEDCSGTERICHQSPINGIWFAKTLEGRCNTNGCSRVAVAQEQCSGGCANGYCK